MYQQISNVMGRELTDGLMYQGLLSQSALLAYIDAFQMFGMISAVCVCLVIFFKKIDIGHGNMVGVH